jgi:hypothetical protein
LLALTRGESRTGSAEGRPAGQPAGLTRQIESAYLALRHTLLDGRVLCSRDPAGLEQEMWALLALYQALRVAISDAIQAVPDTDPDRASYQIAVQTAADLVTSASNIITDAADLTGDIGRAVLANLHGPRRPRVCARRVKSPLSRWNKHPPGKPRKNLRVAKITTAINPDQQQKSPNAGELRLWCGRQAPSQIGGDFERMRPPPSLCSRSVSVSAGGLVGRARGRRGCGCTGHGHLMPDPAGAVESVARRLAGGAVSDVGVQGMPVVGGLHGAVRPLDRAQLARDP